MIAPRGTGRWHNRRASLQAHPLRNRRVSLRAHPLRNPSFQPLTLCRNL